MNDIITAGWAFDGPTNTWTYTGEWMETVPQRDGWRLANALDIGSHNVYYYRLADPRDYRPIHDLTWVNVDYGYWMGERVTVRASEGDRKVSGPVHHIRKEANTGHWVWFVDGEEMGRWASFSHARHYANRFNRSEQLGCEPSHPRCDTVEWPLARLNNARRYGQPD